MRLQTSPPQRHTCWRAQLLSAETSALADRPDRQGEGTRSGCTASLRAWGVHGTVWVCYRSHAVNSREGRGVGPPEQPHYQLAHGGAGCQAQQVRQTMGVNTWRRGRFKLLAFPRWAQEQASSGFPASGFVRTHAGLRDLQANDGTPTSGSGRRGQARSGGLRGHTPPVAGGLTEWPLLAKQLLGRKCSRFFPRGSSPVPSISQLSLKLLEISTTRQKILPPAGW